MLIVKKRSTVDVVAHTSRHDAAIMVYLNETAGEGPFHRFRKAHGAHTGLEKTAFRMRTDRMKENTPETNQIKVHSL
jgi:hypothetical protein